MKNIFLKLTVFLAVIGLSVAYTFALLTDQEYADNKITPGFVDVQVVENGTYFETGGGLEYETSIPAQKVFTVANSNETNDPQLNLTAAYIRVAVVATVQDQAGYVKPIDGSPYISFNSLLSGPNWSKQADGYFYYALPVEPEGMTEELVIEMDNPGDDVLEVSVLAEGIAARQLNSDGDNILDIWDVALTSNP